MSLQSRLTDLVQAVGADIKALRAAASPGFPEQLVVASIPIPAATAASVLGHAISATGTATAAADATGGTAQAMTTRVNFLVTAAAATAVAGVRTNSRHALRANGFRLLARAGQATGTAVATRRSFMGMAYSIAAPTDVNPSTLTDIIGLGYDAADANLQIMHNDNAGTATKIDLGSGFPRPTADLTAMYRLDLVCATGATTVTYRVTNLSTGVVASGTISTDLPAVGTNLGYRAWASVGGTSSVVGMSSGGFYIWAGESAPAPTSLNSGVRILDRAKIEASTPTGMYADTTPLDVVGLSLEFECDGVTPIDLIFDGWLLVSSTAAGGIALLRFFEVGVTDEIYSVPFTVPFVGSRYDACPATANILPSAGLHQYKVAIQNLTTSGIQVGGGNGTTDKRGAMFTARTAPVSV